MMDAEAQWLVRCQAVERLERADGVVEPGAVVYLDASTAAALLLAGRVVCVSQETEAGTVGDRPEQRGTAAGTVRDRPERQARGEA